MNHAHTSSRGSIAVRAVVLGIVGEPEIMPEHRAIHDDPRPGPVAIPSPMDARPAAEERRRIMPSITITRYSKWQLRELLYGSSFLPWTGFQGDHAAKERAWKALRSEILPAWISERPGSRPSAWWTFDAPERRRRVDGQSHPFDNQERIALVNEIAAQPGTAPDYHKKLHALSYGVPNAMTVLDDFDAEYEREFDHLDRLDLLTPDERIALAAADDDDDAEDRL